MFEDDDSPKKKVQFEIGQKLDDFSVQELAETIETLKNEIERLTLAKQSKSEHLSAADALFGKKG